MLLLSLGQSIKLPLNLTTLKLQNFRNYEKESLTLSPKTNIFIGNNGAGKTNILESINVLALARSYKSSDEDMIKNGTDFFKIEGLLELQKKTETLLLIGSKEGKKVFIKGAEVKKLSDFIGHLNVVLFSPEDLFLLKNGPQEKRKLMDLSLLQISRQYVEDYSAFKKQLKYRNNYLKYLLPKINVNEPINDEMLEVITLKFIECNKKIFEARERFVQSLEKITKEKYSELSGGNDSIEFKYLPNFENTLDFYKDKYRSDLLAGTTQYGIQRDDILFSKNGINFGSSSSQGEERMLSLSIKLALATMIFEIKNEAPVVLLDDVFSELDKNHQKRLLSMLDSQMQIIITTTDLEKIGKDALANAKVFEINNNHIKEIQQ